MNTIKLTSYTGASIYDGALRCAGGRLVDFSAADRGAALRVALYDVPPCDLNVPGIAIPRLSINLRNAPVRGSLCGDRPRNYEGRRYSLFLTPPGAEAHWQKDSRSRHINIYFSPEVLADADESADPQAFLERPLLNAHRPRVRRWIDALELAMVQDEPFAAEACLSLARLIVASLASERAPQAGLSARLLERVHEYVLANLDAPLRIATLAATVSMTPGRFALAFNAASGRSASRYVLEQRVAQARRLLRQTRREVADIAAECGFSSQQHLTTAMRRLLGTTPGQLRRATTPQASRSEAAAMAHPAATAGAADDTTQAARSVPV